MYAGAPTGDNAKLSYNNDVVFFIDVLSKQIQLEDGSIWGFARDQFCSDGIVRPVPDEYTPFRVKLFSRLILSSLATQSMMVLETLIKVYLISGMRGRVGHEQVIIIDWSRILVAEATLSPTTRQAAIQAIRYSSPEAGKR